MLGRILAKWHSYEELYPFAAPAGRGLDLLPQTVRLNLHLRLVMTRLPPRVMTAQTEASY